MRRIMRRIRRRRRRRRSSSSSSRRQRGEEANDQNNDRDGSDDQNNMMIRYDHRAQAAGPHHLPPRGQRNQQNPRHGCGTLRLRLQENAADWGMPSVVLKGPGYPNRRYVGFRNCGFGVLYLVLQYLDFSGVAFGGSMQSIAEDRRPQSIEGPRPSNYPPIDFK